MLILKQINYLTPFIKSGIFCSGSGKPLLKDLFALTAKFNNQHIKANKCQMQATKCKKSLSNKRRVRSKFKNNGGK